MSKKIKPNLKDYLKTGKRTKAGSGQIVEDGPTAGGARTAEGASTQDNVRNGAFLDLLAPSDFKMWETIITTGIAVQRLSLDVGSMRKDFEAMDGSRFTCYILPKKGEPLRPVRTAAQIQHPLALLLKWDEMGALTVCQPDG